jgi:hypothetical protein
MAVKLTPAGAIGKWVIAPIVLLLIGYFVIGPNLGRSAGKQPKESIPAGGASTPSDAPLASTDSGKDGTPPTPDVDVTVRHGNETDVAVTPPRPRHRNRKSAPKPDEDKTPAETPKSPPPAPATDDGSSSGPLTTGGQGLA